MGVLRRLLQKSFTKHLLVTNVISSGVIMWSGDFVQQSVDRLRYNKQYDEKRGARMLTMGLMMAPFAHGWYKFLDGSLPGRSKGTVIRKVTADQLIASPLLLVGFFIGIGKLEGKTLGNALSELRQKFPFLYLVDCFFWPPLQAINFLFVPPHLRVIYVNIALLVWDVFLSYIKHEDSHQGEAQAREESTLDATVPSL